MASYTELFDFNSNSAFRNRVAVAVTVKAQALIVAASPTAAQVAWANTALANPGAKAELLMRYVLAANKSASVAQIQAATDDTLQTHVNTAADALIARGAN